MSVKVIILTQIIISWLVDQLLADNFAVVLHCANVEFYSW